MSRRTRKAEKAAQGLNHGRLIFTLMSSLHGLETLICIILCQQARQLNFTPCDARCHAERERARAREREKRQNTQVTLLATRYSRMTNARRQLTAARVLMMCAFLSISFMRSSILTSSFFSFFSAAVCSFSGSSNIFFCLSDVGGR